MDNSLKPIYFADILSEIDIKNNMYMFAANLRKLCRSELDYHKKLTPTSCIHNKYNEIAYILWKYFNNDVGLFGEINLLLPHITNNVRYIRKALEKNKFVNERFICVSDSFAGYNTFGASILNLSLEQNEYLFGRGLTINPFALGNYNLFRHYIRGVLRFRKKNAYHILGLICVSMQYTIDKKIVSETEKNAIESIIARYGIIHNYNHIYKITADIMSKIYANLLKMLSITRTHTEENYMRKNVGIGLRSICYAAISNKKTSLEKMCSYFPTTFDIIDPDILTSYLVSTKISKNYEESRNTVDILQNYLFISSMIVGNKYIKENVNMVMDVDLTNLNIKK